MKTLWFIGVLLLWKPSFSQDSCRPRYAFAVKTLQVAGVDLAYVEEGRGSAVLFLHGLGGNIAHWQKNIRDLSSRYRCIAVDLPGYGHSSKNFDPPADALDFYARVLTVFLKKKKIRKVALAGHSMGAQLAMVMALKEPALVTKLVLVAPAGLETFSDAEAQLITGATTADALEKQEEPVIRYQYKQNFYRWPSDADALLEDRLRFRRCADFGLYVQAVSRGVKGMLQHPVKNQWSQLKAPVLILFGENDALIPNRVLHPGLSREELVKEATARMRNARALTLPEAGHMVQFEKSAETSKAIMDFLQ